MRWHICTSCQNILRYSGISHLFYFSDRYSNTDLHCLWHTWWSHNFTHFACIGSSAVDSQVNTFRCTFLVEVLLELIIHDKYLKITIYIWMFLELRINWKVAKVNMSCKTVLLKIYPHQQEDMVFQVLNLKKHCYSRYQNMLHSFGIPFSLKFNNIENFR